MSRCRHHLFVLKLKQKHYETFLEAETQQVEIIWKMFSLAEYVFIFDIVFGLYIFFHCRNASQYCSTIGSRTQWQNQRKDIKRSSWGT